MSTPTFSFALAQLVLERWAAALDEAIAGDVDPERAPATREELLEVARAAGTLSGRLARFCAKDGEAAAATTDVAGAAQARARTGQ